MGKHWLQRYLILASAVFVLCSRSAAQSSQGTIILRIVEETPQLERFIEVRLVERNTQSVVQDMRAEADTEIVLRDVPYGTYDVIVASDSLLLAEQEVTIRSSVPVRVRLTAPKEYRLGEIVVNESAGLSVSSQSVPRTVYTASVIDRLPSVASNKRIEAILMDTPRVVPDEDGRMHLRGEHAQLQYIIDGIPVTADMSRVCSSLLDPKFVKSLEVLTGSLNAEYGVASSGILAITSKSGFDRPLFGHGAIQYGSFGERETNVEVGGNLHSQSAFYATASIGESNRYLDPISGFDPIHDYGKNESLFGKFNTILGQSVDFNMLGTFNRTHFEVPNSTLSIRQDQQQTLNDYLLGGRLNLQLDQQSLLSFLAYTRYGSAAITSGGLSRISNASDSLRAIQENEKFFIGGDRKQRQNGAQLEYSTRIGAPGASHEVKFGIAGEEYPLSEFFTFAVTNPALSDSSVPGGDIRYRAIDITQGGHALLVDEARRGTRFSAYMQDEVSKGQWRIGIGLRYDAFDLFQFESHFSPRINLAYALNDDVVLRTSYNRIVMQAPLENILVSSSDQAHMLAGQAQGTVPTRVSSERSHVFELGAAYRLNEYWDVDVTGYSKLIDNFLVNVELGNSGVIFPVNLKQGFVGGGELRVRLHEWHRLSGTFSFSTCVSDGLRPSDASSPIAAGLILGEEGRNYSNPFAGESSFPTEHNQLFTSVINLGYRVSGAITAMLAGRFDSGLPFDLTDKYGSGLDEQASQVELRRRGYSDDVINLLSLTPEEPGSPDKSVAPHAIFDFGLTADVSDLIPIPLAFSVSVINLLDTQYLYKFESSFGGTHFGVPRTFVLRADLSQ